MGDLGVAHCISRSVPKMKYLSKLSLILLLVLTAVFAFPGQAHAQGPDDGKVVFGGTYRLAAGETLNGSLAIFGGTATLEKGSKVNGSVVITGGTLEIQGEVSGDITTVGGALTIGDSAHLHGSIYTVGGALNRAPGAEIDGSIVSGAPNDFSIPTPNLNRNLFNLNLNPLTDMLGRTIAVIFQSFAMAVLALLVAMFLLQPTERVLGAINAQPIISGAFGLLTVIVAPALLLLLAITLILIPVSAVGAMLLVVAFAFGWIALGLELGRRMAEMFKVQWGAPVEAALGTLILSLIVSLIAQIPCIGWLAAPILGMIGLGGVVLTRFGTQAYTGSAPAAAAPYPVAPVVSPMAPVVPPASPRATAAPAPVHVYEVPAEPEPPAPSADEPLPENPGDDTPGL
jgi:hypothetical protein